MITRAEVLTRATTIWKPGTVPYSQDTIHQPDGYRQDCSGYLSLCWGLSPNADGGWGGQNTVTLVTRGYMKEIPASDLRPGDAVGNCGIGTGGDAGHIVLFEKWANDDPNNDDFWLWEQAGGANGPRRRMVTYPYPGMSAPPWKAYRFAGITDNPFVPGGDMKPAGLVGPIQAPRAPRAHENYSIPPVNAGAVEWGPAWITFFTDLFGGRAALRVAITPGDGTWSFLGEIMRPGEEPTVIVDSGLTENFALPAGTRGVSVMRLPIDADDPCTGSVSFSIEYGARG
jgi:hypothetical protein